MRCTETWGEKKDSSFPRSFILFVTPLLSSFFPPSIYRISDFSSFATSNLNILLVFPFSILLLPHATFIKVFFRIFSSFLSPFHLVSFFFFLLPFFSSLLTFFFFFLVSPLFFLPPVLILFYLPALSLFQFLLPIFAIAFLSVQLFIIPASSLHHLLSLLYLPFHPLHSLLSSFSLPILSPSPPCSFSHPYLSLPSPLSLPFPRALPCSH